MTQSETWDPGRSGTPGFGVGHRLGHRLKPVSDMRNLLKQVDTAPSALERTLAISRRFESAVLVEMMTNALVSNRA